MSAIIETIYQNFHYELECFIVKKVNDRALAKDILQDVFVKIHLHLHTIKDQTKLNAWIYQLTRNTIIDYYRKNVEKTEMPEDITDDNIQTEHGLENCVSPFISLLPTKYQEAIILTDINGMSQTQLAAHLNITYSAAKSRVQRARQKLKILFTDCCSIHTDTYGNVLSYKKLGCNKPCD
jgi:RNA polymerase sigma-70 factor, ECF subfamily